MQIYLIIGLLFSPFAALMAYVITYSEYQHHYPTKEKPRELAFESAIFTFAIFMLLTLFIGFFINKFIS